MRRFTRGQTSAFCVLLLAGLPFVSGELAYAGQTKDGAPGKCLLWKTESGSATVYLLGSVHVADRSMYPLDPAIEKAFKDSDKLVVEINLLKVDPRRMQQLVFQKGMYPPGETLEKNISKKTLKKLEAVLQKERIPMAAVARLRPWLISLTLTKQSVEKLGYSSALGIDTHFLERATEEKMEILELETVEGQFSMLAEWPKDLQELFLLSTVEEFSETKVLMGKMVEAWKNGDAKALDQVVRKMARDNPELDPVVKKLFDDRNVKMLSKIQGYLKSDGTYFVVAGAGHMVGKKGIVQLLRDKGHKVEQMEKKGTRVPAGVK